MSSSRARVACSSLHEHLTDVIGEFESQSSMEIRKHFARCCHRVDTDLLVRQPVHPAAFRLLILHALYRGPEKRRTTRVSIGAPMSAFASDCAADTAVLAELSTRGCRMMADPNCHRAVPDRLVTDRPATRGHRRQTRLSRCEDTSCASRVQTRAETDVIAVLFEVQRRSRAQDGSSRSSSAHSHGPAVLDEAVALRAALPTDHSRRR